MTKNQVADILEEIGLLLELKGENPFKTRAYFNGARTLQTVSEDLDILVKEKRLGELKGIGQALQDKITTLVTSGALPYYDELKASIPPGLMEILDIPGLGPKKVKVLHDKLKIADLAGLEAACTDGRIAKLEGMGEKTATNILAGIQQRKAHAGQHLYGKVIETAEDILDWLRGHPNITRLELAGSLRRGKEIIKDIDLVGSSRKPEKVMASFVDFEDVERIINHGETKSSVLLNSGIQVDLRLVSDKEFPYALHHFTGSKEHNVAMRQRAIERGMKLSEWGLFEGKNEDKLIPCYSEEEIFRELELDYIPPELREGLDEIKVAEEGKIPRLLEWTDLHGSFHNHSTASDGENTLREMAEAAASIGLDYLGIADHSKSSFQANGLDEDRLLAQVLEIKQLNKELEGDIHIFSGTECDILKDGSLDFNDGILEQLDYVVASVHASFTLSEKDMTKRIIRAMENPYVTMLGHLTGRLLLRREAYAVDHNKIIDCAAETGTWIELNANPYRLDMDWRWWRKARDKGVKCVINPDAHSVSQLGYLKLGVQQARKGWLRKQDVINCLSLGAVKKELKKKSS